MLSKIRNTWPHRAVCAGVSGGDGHENGEGEDGLHGDLVGSLLGQMQGHRAHYLLYPHTYLRVKLYTRMIDVYIGFA